MGSEQLSLTTTMMKDLAKPAHHFEPFLLSQTRTVGNAVSTTRHPKEHQHGALNSPCLTKTVKQPTQADLTV